MRAVVVPVALVALVAGAESAHADRKVTGTVVDDATGKPVAGALVAVGAVELASDDAGRFTVPEVPFGRLDVVVIADGYRAYFGSARAGGELAIRLAADTSAGEVIHVTGRAPSKPPLHL